MEKITDLKALLRHEVQDLCSAEDQIIAALPKMIEKAGDTQLKNALTEHLRVTEGQRSRLDQVQQLLSAGGGDEEEKKKGLLGRLFSTTQKCKGTQGIVEEGEKIMSENMDADVMDAAIIASAQKIEHYEICGYGTARAWAAELGLTEVEALLQQTLDEEYEADNKLTKLATGRLNKEAENETGTKRSRSAEPAGSRRAGTSTRKTAGGGEMVPAASRTSGAAKSSDTGGRSLNTRNTGTERGSSTGRNTKGSKGTRGSR